MMRVTMGFYLILEWGKVVVVLVVIFDDVKVVKFGRRSFGRMNRRALEKKALYLSSHIEKSHPRKAILFAWNKKVSFL